MFSSYKKFPGQNTEVVATNDTNMVKSHCRFLKTILF